MSRAHCVRISARPRCAQARTILSTCRRGAGLVLCSTLLLVICEAGGARAQPAVTDEAACDQVCWKIADKYVGKFQKCVTEAVTQATRGNDSWNVAPCANKITPKWWAAITTPQPLCDNFICGEARASTVHCSAHFSTLASEQWAQRTFVVANTVIAAGLISQYSCNAEPIP